jgi:hypothetical protein
MNRILAIALSTAIALAAPAAASAAVQIDFHKWTVTTQNGKEHRVSPGGTFKRCGRKVTRLTATYDYDGATPGQSYKQIWSLDGSDILKTTGTFKHEHSTVKVSLFKKSGNPIDDGKYRLRLRKSGKGLGSSTVKIRPGSDC